MTERLEAAIAADKLLIAAINKEEVSNEDTILLCLEEICKIIVGLRKYASDKSGIFENKLSRFRDFSDKIEAAAKAAKEEAEKKGESIPSALKKKIKKAKALKAEAEELNWNRR